MKIRFSIQNLAIATAFAFLLFLLGITPYARSHMLISGDSMFPTLRNGDVVKIHTDGTDRVRRGDIIIIERGDVRYVKRVIACPEDTISIENDRIYVNDVFAGFMKGFPSGDGIEPQTYPLRLGTGEYFVMGDNHEVSFDSRFASFGTVRDTEIKAIVVTNGVDYVEDGTNSE